VIQPDRGNRQNRQGTWHLLCRGRGTGRGKIPVDVQKDNIDMLAVSGTRFMGPKGVALVRPSPQSPRSASAIIDGAARARHAFRHLERARHRGLARLAKSRRKMPEEARVCSVCARRLRKGLEAKLDEFH